MMIFRNEVYQGGALVEVEIIDLDAGTYRRDVDGTTVEDRSLTDDELQRWTSHPTHPVAVMLWNEDADRYEGVDGGLVRPSAAVVFWRGGPDPTEDGFDPDRDEWHVLDDGGPATAPSVSINEGDTASGEVGQDIQLTVFVTGNPTPALAWTSDDETKATVDEFGLVTLVAEGEAVITVTATNSEGSDQASLTLTVQAESATPPTADDIEAEPESSTSILVTLLTAGEGGVSRTWHMGETEGFTPDETNEISGGSGSALVSDLDPDTTRWFRTLLTNSAGSTPSNEASATTNPEAGTLMHDEFVNETGSNVPVHGRTPDPTPLDERTWAADGVNILANTEAASLVDTVAYDIGPNEGAIVIDAIMEHRSTIIANVIIRGVAATDMSDHKDNRLRLEIRPNDIRLTSTTDGSSTVLSGTQQPLTRVNETPTHYRIRDDDGDITVWVDDQLIIGSTEVAEHNGESWVGAFSGGTNSTSSLLHDFKVTSL